VLGLQDEVQAAGQREKTYHYSAQKREESRVSQMQRQIRPQGQAEDPHDEEPRLLRGRHQGDLQAQRPGQAAVQHSSQ